jgi:ribose transport system ATP-binding protein
VGVTPLVELRDVSVAYGSTVALSRVSFDLLPGEVHVVAGENGAGKTTLIRVMAGALTDFSGEVRVSGSVVRFRTPADSVRAGIATIHQELSLVPALSVADNLSLGSEGSPLSPVRRDENRARARSALDRVGLAVDPDAPVETLSLAERQLIEIARALARNAKVLVMDEPTSALAEPEVLRLFEIVRELNRGGTGVVYISHRLKEIETIADRVSILRDGERTLVTARAKLTREAMLGAMLGRRPSDPAAREHRSSAEPRLVVRNISGPRAGSFRDVAFSLARGEIVGLAGAEGSGASEILRALGGDLPGSSGTVELDGAPFAPEDPRAAQARRVIYLSSDRRSSVVPDLSIVDNALLSMSTPGPLAWLDRTKQEGALEPEARRLRIKAASLDSPTASLSGGNQQKVALLRCLMSKPRLLLLDDPARGVDLGAKADLFARLTEAAAAGMTILLHSSDLTELVSHADRVLVLFRGRIVATFAGGELDEERLLAPVMGATT